LIDIPHPRARGVEMMLKSIIESRAFNTIITAVIILNAVTLGLETWPKAMTAAAVMATKLFGEDFPGWFGSIGTSMFTLFQVMTLESWSMGIVRPVMDVYPGAWLFFVPFIVVTTFTVLNLFIALIVNSMQSLQAETNAKLREEAVVAYDERDLLLLQMEALTDEVRLMRDTMMKA